eukprot:TRINITY_DN4748_c0_g1_i1.p1 TRINITY_DN4748_c0_g1~~TRINITY_DN4748_c0_g1_i1.p1  ORF type:complete len:133 (+),score=6.78 TRINITY_DN4748_c0_g1_i1:76-474(+)
MEQAKNTSHVDVYGFVGWITSFIAFGAYLLWAYIPDPLLHQLGLVYYPHKYWAIAIPAWLGVTIIFGIVVYTALNLMRTEPLDSYNTFKDEFSKESLEKETNSESIPPISDIPLVGVNKLLYARPMSLHKTE